MKKTQFGWILIRRVAGLRGSQSLNRKTKKDSLCAPRIDESSQKLYKAKIFRRSAYIAIMISPEAAFRFEGQLYDFGRMCLASSTWNRFIKKVLSGFEPSCSHHFDIMIVSDVESNERHLKVILQACLEAGITLKSKKYDRGKLGRWSMMYDVEYSTTSKEFLIKDFR